MRIISIILFKEILYYFLFLKFFEVQRQLTVSAEGLTVYFFKGFTVSVISVFVCFLLHIHYFQEEALSSLN